MIARVPRRSSWHLRMDRVPSAGPGSPPITRWPDKPRWAPDGRTLYFISRRPTSYFNLWAVRFDPERGTPIDEPYALTQFDSPSLVISPDIATLRDGCLVAPCRADNEDGARQHLDARQRGPVRGADSSCLTPHCYLFAARGAQPLPPAAVLSTASLGEREDRRCPAAAPGLGAASSHLRARPADGLRMIPPVFASTYLRIPSGTPLD